MGWTKAVKMMTYRDRVVPILRVTNYLLVPIQIDLDVSVVI